jgi:hypothetical protein
MMLGEDWNWQVVINLTFGIVVFFGGWMLKVIFGLMNKMQDDYKDLHSVQYKELVKIREDLTNLALSIPKEYVVKDDFKDWAERMDERFDKLEEKLDSLR